MLGTSLARRLVVGATVGTVVAAAVTATAGAAGIIVKPSSNLVVGQGSYAVAVTAPKGTFGKVPSATAPPIVRTVTTKAGSAAVVGGAGTFSAADVGNFVDDGPGGRLPDGVAVTALSPLAPPYPRQGLASIKGVNASGSTATLTQKALAAGSGPVDEVAATAPIVLVTQSSGSIAFIAPTPVGLCLLPAFPGVCARTPPGTWRTTPRSRSCSASIPTAA